MTDLTLKLTRERLAVRKAPYWHLIEEGQAIGFRRGPDTWVARFLRDGRHHYQSLGKCATYTDAVRRAGVWFDQMGKPGVEPMRGTVREALEAYIEDLRDLGRIPAATDILRRFETLVWKHEIAGIPLERLTVNRVTAWRRGLHTGKVKRSHTTVNRYVGMLAAGLSRAVALGWVGDRETWQLTQIPDPSETVVDAGVYLTREQREALLAACSPEARAFFRALDLTGARPREIAATAVRDFDGRKLSLCHKKGKPFTLRQRFVVLPGEARELLAAQAAGKGQAALLFPAPGGVQWERHTWAKAFRRAVLATQRAGSVAVPVEASAYDLRHTRISELLQELHVDPITVAKQCGTSIQMISRTYAKFIPDALEEKLAGL